MATTTRHESGSGSSAPKDDIRPNNPLQADFDAEDNSSMDSDERYLVRLSES